MWKERSLNVKKIKTIFKSISNANEMPMKLSLDKILTTMCIVNSKKAIKQLHILKHQGHNTRRKINDFQCYF